MDKDRISGAANKAKGTVKDAVGTAAGDTETQAESKPDSRGHGFDSLARCASAGFLRNGRLGV
jgi:hypothetical protein